MNTTKIEKLVFISTKVIFVLFAVCFICSVVVISNINVYAESGSDTSCSAEPFHECNCCETLDDNVEDYPVETMMQRTVLPSSVNLSALKYFPQIREQQGGSCVAWATTYYQFTYEVAKINDFNAKENAEYAFSPKYVWNYLNRGSNSSIDFGDSYLFLKRQGSLRWTDFPQNNLTFDWYDTCNPNSVNPLYDALSNRALYEAGKVFAQSSENNSSPVIVSYDDDNLTSMKTRLYNGQVLTFSTPSPNAWNENNVKVLSNGQQGVIYSVASNSNHAMTIVGYDDNIYYDYNNDGTIQGYERGAFLVANSWGTDFRNNGFVWIMYDALNKTSNVSSYNVQGRAPAINSNLYRYIAVDNFEPSFTVEVTIEQKYRNDFIISLGNSATSSIASSSYKKTFVDKIGGDRSFSGLTNPTENETYTFVFDYSYYCSTSEKYYGVKVTDSNTHSDSTKVKKIVWKDSSGAVIKTITPNDPVNNDSKSYVFANEKTMSLNQVYSGSITNAGDVAYYKFTPTVSGYYVFYTKGSSVADTKAELRDSTGDLMISNSDISSTNKNSAVHEYLLAGNTYYVKLMGETSTTTGTFEFCVASYGITNASIISNNPDARRILFYFEAPSFYNKLKIKIDDQTYTFTRDSNGKINVKTNGIIFGVTTDSNGATDEWFLNVDVSAKQNLLEKNVNFEITLFENIFSSTYQTTVFPYKSSLLGGVNVGATNSLQLLINSITESGYSYSVKNGSNSTVTVTSSTKAATGMKILKKNAAGKICEVYHIVVIGDVQGDGGINSLDASIILQYDSGTGTLTGAYLIAGDVNGDSGVNSLDSSIVLQYDAEMTDISQVLLDTTVPLSVYYQYDVDFGQDSL